MEKWLFFWAATAGLGIYHTGGYGRIGVYTYYRREAPPITTYLRAALPQPQGLVKSV